MRRTCRSGNENQEIDMMKKTVASLGIAAAASAGALLLTGSPASAQTTPASARAGVAYVHTSAERRYGDHRGHDHWRGDYYRHHHGWNRNGDDTRIVISNTNIAVDD
jgi:hypothetical protein